MQWTNCGERMNYEPPGKTLVILEPDRQPQESIILQKLYKSQQDMSDVTDDGEKV